MYFYFSDEAEENIVDAIEDRLDKLLCKGENNDPFLKASIVYVLNRIANTLEEIQDDGIKIRDIVEVRGAIDTFEQN